MLLASHIKRGVGVEVRLGWRSDAVGIDSGARQEKHLRTNERIGRPNRCFDGKESTGRASGGGGMNELEGKICSQQNLISPDSVPCGRPATRTIRVRHKTKPELGTGTVYLCDEHYVLLAPGFVKAS